MAGLCNIEDLLPRQIAELEAAGKYTQACSLEETELLSQGILLV